MYLNSDNALLLAKKLEEIPNVHQVRFNYVSREDLVEHFGPDAIRYVCRVRSLNQVAGSQTRYELFFIILEPRTYEDVQSHGYIQAMMNERIGHYLRTGENLQTTGAFSYPYRMDADGNQIPYELTKNNPQRT